MSPAVERSLLLSSGISDSLVGLEIAEGTESIDEALGSKETDADELSIVAVSVVNEGVSVVGELYAGEGSNADVEKGSSI